LIPPGERRFRLPLVERVDRMDLSIIPVRVEISRIESKCGNRISVHVEAAVRISPDTRLRHRAVEWFLGEPQEKISAAAHAHIEGALREVVPQLSARQLRGDRARFMHSFTAAAEEGFDRMGLLLEHIELL
jgi:flotillin